MHQTLKLSHSYRAKLILMAAVIGFLFFISPGFAESKAKVDFSSQIRPIISSKCFHCHGPDDSSRKAKLRLDIRDEATKERDGKFPIKPGDLAHSEMARRIASKDPDDIMPPPKAGHPLTEQEIELLKKWIQQGAEYTGHWAFKKPTRPALPKIKNKSWAKNPIDYFVSAKLQENGLKPSPAADRYALIRRLSFDITGLPPTPAEVEAFVNDKSSDAYEKVVDRLLTSSAYGEKWARMWLDIARYADSAGYGSDPLRLNIWPYRDWVINALNRNMPFDKFTMEQLAGDLLDNPTDEDVIATAFHRNTMTNTEGGTDDEEWRVAAVKDRVAITVQAWMGLTMGCAQCHSHKFDPITQREYYSFYAFFNQTEDNDQPDERPTLPLPNAEQKQTMDGLKKKITDVEQKLASGSPDFLAELAAWESAHTTSNSWHVLTSPELKSNGGTTFTTLEDNSILASGESPEKDTYTITASSSLDKATAIRLELIPDERLPGKGVGRAKNGNFVLNDFRVTVKPEDDEPKVARFVRVELPGDERILSLAEVQVFSSDTNVAPNGKASQSSVDFEGTPNLAIDGNTDGIYSSKSTTHTKTESNPWWEVDLGSEVSVDAIVVWNRTDSVGERLKNARVLALNSDHKPLWQSKISGVPKQSVKYSLHGEQMVAFRHATATYNEPNFDISEAIDGDTSKKSGWSITGMQSKPQVAVFEPEGTIPAGKLTISMTQNYGRQHTLGRFRISVGNVPPPIIATPSDVSDVLAVSPDKRTPEQRDKLLKWFSEHASSTAKLRSEREDLKRQLDAVKPLAVPVMRELPADKHRVTHLLNKGNFLAPGDEVSPTVPAAFHPWPAGAPTNRIGVAMWLMSPENPLTARVTANRIWAQIFGTGIVETEEDFGTQGTLPSHPELLDWLACELRDGSELPLTPTLSPLVPRGEREKSRAWNIKHLIKTIVMSAAYQQTSRVTSELLAKDPRNRLLSRAPRRRLDAEMVRDQALALSGLLSKKVGGPSVYPPQPDGLWRAAFNGQREYATSKGEDRYRRGLYTIWRRTVPYPSMATFDAPSRESCTFRRLPTNTPLQAYVTLNDPVYVECAQALGRRLVREGGATVDERIAFGLRLVLARPADAKQIAELKKLYESELAYYRNKEADAVKLATNPLGALPKEMNAAEAAAWTTVANVLLNLDGVLTKG